MQIHWRHPNHVSTARQLEVEAELEKLGGTHNDLIDVWIDIDKSQHHKAGQERVKIRCMARNAEIVAEGQGDAVDEALRDALKDFETEVWRRREKLESQRKQRPSS